jgi:hypothetical protein
VAAECGMLRQQLVDIEDGNARLLDVAFEEANEAVTKMRVDFENNVCLFYY